jgi:hypothetical protein
MLRLWAGTIARRYAAMLFAAAEVTRRQNNQVAAQRLLSRSVLWADIDEWLSTPRRWREIREKVTTEEAD